jgi:hypothetical protein
MREAEKGDLQFSGSTGIPSIHQYSYDFLRESPGVLFLNNS